MLTMIHSNPAQIRGGSLLIDRKFHSGMLNYLERLDEPITSVHPVGTPDSAVMDPVEIPIKDLGYQVIVSDGRSQQLIGAVDRCVRASRLVYGEGMGVEAIALECEIPQVAVLEYDRSTQISVATNQVSNPLRKLSRRLKTAAHYKTAESRWRRMTALHCNGYPIFDATQDCNPDRLLYLDSRMDAEMVIDRVLLEHRLVSRTARLKLLFSGRFEHIKGALDCVKVAIECLQHGLDIELHCYGQGSLRDPMLQLVTKANCADRVVIHDAVPFPELARIATTFDAFVCCHTQSDPSCTYIESFGAGLPIVGYGNTMWSRLCDESQAGFHSPLNRPELVSRDIARLVADRELLAKKSRQAREFAAHHTFEREFRKRTDDMVRLMRKE